MQTPGKLFSLAIAFSVLSGIFHADSAFADMPTKEEVKKEVEKSLKETASVSNEKKGFKLKYPKNWEEAEPTDGPLACKFKTLNGLVSARLAIEALPNGMTLETYSKLTSDQVKAGMAAQHMPITLVEEGKSELSSQPAIRSVYTYPLEGTPLTAKVLQILTIKNGNGFVFNYTAADANLYDQFMSVMNEVVKSIELL